MKVVLLALVCVVLALAGCAGFRLTQEEIDRSDELGRKALETQAELEAVYAAIKKAKEEGFVGNLPELIAKASQLQDDVILYQKKIAEIIDEAKERSKKESPWETAGNVLMQLLIGLAAYATGHKGRKILYRTDV